MATNNATLGFFTPKDVEAPFGGSTGFFKRGSTPVLAFDRISPFPDARFAGVLPHGANAGYTATTGVKVIVAWSSANAASTGSVVWGASFQLDGQTDKPVPYNDNFPAFNAANEIQAITPANATTAGGMNYTTLSVPIASVQNGQTTAPIAGDHYRLRIRRVDENAADTMAGVAYLHSVELQDY